MTAQQRSFVQEGRAKAWAEGKVERKFGVQREEEEEERQEEGGPRRGLVVAKNKWGLRFRYSRHVYIYAHIYACAHARTHTH